MSQTKETRMLLHYRSLMKRYGHRHPADLFYPEEASERVNTYVWLPMARIWKMPVREVKDTIARERNNEIHD